jgi:hypothetical protein
MNVFSFADGYALDLFIRKSLIAPQSNALRHLQIYGWLIAWGATSPSVDKMTLRLLGGLEHFDLCADLTGAQKRPPRNIGLSAFFGLGFKHVRVAVDFGGRSLSGKLESFRTRFTEMLTAKLKHDAGIAKASIAVDQRESKRIKLQEGAEFAT